MNEYQMWIMPENKIFGNYDKWIKYKTIKVQNRKLAVESITKSYKLGLWKVRKI